MKLTEMRELLSTRGIQLTKSLGQNFLHDQNQLARIAGLGQLKPGDKILEIGPGLGPLTELLLDSGAHVLAIEMDRRLCEVLTERFGSRPNFELINADALHVIRKQRRGWTEWKLVANLPYSVASPILVELATGATPPERLVALLQWEVVQRIMAKHATEHYGMLSLFLQLRYQPRESFKVPPQSFFPPPDVDSACIQLIRRERDLLDPAHTRLFMRIVKRAFSERRKMMLKLLKHDWPADRLEPLFAAAGIHPQERAEKVSLAQFVQITEALAAPSDNPASTAPDTVPEVSDGDGIAPSNPDA